LTKGFIGLMALLGQGNPVLNKWFTMSIGFVSWIWSEFKAYDRKAIRKETGLKRRKNNGRTTK
jgi:hypothetical protein